MSNSGYQNLIVYQQAVLIFDLNALFCHQYLNKTRDARTIDQMTQAARSGKQNIVEASLERSAKLNIKLTAVARGSFGELLEDYKDFLRVKSLGQWDKNDTRLGSVRAMRVPTNSANLSNMTNLSNLTNWSNWTNSPERFANLMITLIFKENYLLDRMIKSLEEKFVNSGGYSENLTKMRLRKRKEQLADWLNRRSN